MTSPGKHDRYLVVRLLSWYCCLTCLVSGTGRAIAGSASGQQFQRKFIRILKYPSHHRYGSLDDNSVIQQWITLLQNQTGRSCCRRLGVEENSSDLVSCSAAALVGSTAGMAAFAFPFEVGLRSALTHHPAVKLKVGDTECPMQVTAMRASSPTVHRII